LMAGRAIDKRRATLQQAAISRNLADPVIAAQRLDFVRAASREYWTWVATGRRYQVAASVLKIAEDRDTQLAELVERGALAELERTDNQRVIVERQLRLIAAERAWQQASIALSLYLRGPDGEPQMPPATRLPKDVAEPQPFERTNLANDIELALVQRPELRRLQLQRERTGVDLHLARNQMLPSINLGLEGYQDVGFGSSFSKTPLVTGTQLDRTTYIASLQLDLPLERRDARGRAMTAQSAMVQLSFQEQFQRDRIAAELRDAASALERSYELLKKARENVAVARKVESGERERFTKGQGTIVILNLRELVAVEASFAEVDALAEYYRSLADYQAAIGIGGLQESANQ
jgi:outer membrane protein, heavy metal efflux system